MAKTVKIALLGAGTVGTQVARLLDLQSQLLAARAGVELELIGIAVRDITAPRDPAIRRELLTTDADSLIEKADLVIELIGGIEPPFTYVSKALATGKSVVTGNKALLATHGPELYELAADNDVDLYYEAAVAGAVPVVYGLRESLAGDSVNAVLGIMNGTTNYILDQMTTAGMDYEQALQMAQELGYAEADPTADVDGFDAGAKIAILASLAFHLRVSLADVNVQGIREITAQDIANAKDAGYNIKLIAKARRYKKEQDGLDGVSVTVAPTLVPLQNPLASVAGSFNSVMIEAQAADRLMFYGRGAGGAPTASAVLSDVVAAAAKKVSGGHAPREIIFGDTKLIPFADTFSKFYLRISVADTPGVLAQVAKILADNAISLDSVRQAAADVQASSTQKNAHDVTRKIEITVITHAAKQADITRACGELQELPEVFEINKILRVEEN